MNSNRSIIVLAWVVLGVFVAGGVLLMRSSEPPTAPTVPPNSSAPKAAGISASVVTTPAQTDAEMARLRQENDLLKTQLDNMRAELSQAKQQATLAKSAAEASDAKSPEAETEDVPEATSADAGDDSGRERRRREERGGGWNEERMAQFREGVDQFYEEALASADTPEAQERITAIRDYSNQMMELRQQIRATEDDAAREALRAEMDGLRDEMRPLVKDQQDYLLRQAAASAGVTSESTQNQLNQALRDVMRSPFFMPGFGSGRGGPDGGMGGGGRGTGGSGGGGAR